MSNDISIVIVNWNTRDLLLNCLASIFQQEGVSCDVIVVDNASTDGSLEAVSAAYPQVTCLQTGGNWGFAKANNYAFPLCRGKYVLLLNPDISLTPGVLRGMATYLQENIEVGALGCELLYEDGRLQSGPRTFPTILGTTLQLLFSLPPKLARSPSNTCEVDWLSGAVLMVRKEILESVGGLKESYFMYGEDIEWCYRIKQQGWRLRYKSDLKVFHFLGKSNQAGAKFYTIYNYRNLLDFFSSKEPGLWGKTKILALRFAYILGGLTHLTYYGIGHLLRPQNPYYRDRIQAYRAVICIGLRKNYPNL